MSLRTRITGSLGLILLTAVTLGITRLAFERCSIISKLRKQSSVEIETMQPEHLAWMGAGKDLVSVASNDVISELPSLAQIETLKEVRLQFKIGAEPLVVSGCSDLRKLDLEGASVDLSGCVKLGFLALTDVDLDECVGWEDLESLEHLFLGNCVGERFYQLPKPEGLKSLFLENPLNEVPWSRLVGLEKLALGSGIDKVYIESVPWTELSNLERVAVAVQIHSQISLIVPESIEVIGLDDLYPQLPRQN